MERIFNPLTPRPEVCLSLDAAQLGLGGASCGPRPMEKYMLAPRPAQFTYVMRPCQAGYEKLNALARAPVSALHAPQIARDEEGFVTLSGSGDIRYTLDGSEPTASSRLYTAPFACPKAATVRAAAFTAAGGRSAMATQTFAAIAGGVKRNPAKTKISECDSQQAGEGEATNAIDGQTQTFWHSQWSPAEKPYPHHLTLDLGEELAVVGIAYQGRSDGNDNGWIKKYQVFVSADGKRWGAPALEGEFPTPQDREQRVLFAAPVRGRFVKLVALSEHKGRAFATVAELGVLVQPQ